MKRIWQSLMVCVIVLPLLLAGGAPAATQLSTQVPKDASQSPVYPGADWTWVDRPESMGWSSAKLALAQAFANRIGSAAVMIIDDGIVVAAWGDMTHKYFCHSMRKSLMSAPYGVYSVPPEVPGCPPQSRDHAFDERLQRAMRNRDLSGGHALTQGDPYRGKFSRAPGPWPRPLAPALFRRAALQGR
jgi:hypothetical protein